METRSVRDEVEGLWVLCLQFFSGSPKLFMGFVAKIALSVLYAGKGSRFLVVARKALIP